jgi:hypothetical protein
MYLNVKVFPKSGKSEIEGFRNGELVIRLRNVADKGKANEELIELISNHYQVDQRYIHITKGKTNRHKTLYIEEE